MEKTIELINERICDGNAVVVTAERMPGVVAELGEEGALAEVDVVTTGTFGAMCSSGAFLNFGHADPPIRMERVWLNDVEAYGGLAAVDAYIGATQQSETRRDQYGGAHVIEDLVSGRRVEPPRLVAGHGLLPAPDHPDRARARGPEPGRHAQPAERVPAVQRRGQHHRPRAPHLHGHAPPEPRQHLLLGRGRPEPALERPVAPVHRPGRPESSWAGPRGWSWARGPRPRRPAASAR